MGELGLTDSWLGKIGTRILALMVLLWSFFVRLVMNAWTDKVGHHNQEPEEVGGGRAQE